MSTACQYSTFFVERLHLAIDVDHVQEVAQTMAATPVPLSNDVIDGLVNLRGQIVTAVDLRSRLGLPRQPGKPAVDLVVRTSSGLISLRVDRQGDVVSLPLSRSAIPGREGEARAQPDFQLGVLQPPPDTVQGALREVAVGIIQLPDSLLIVLDVDQLLTAAVGLQHPQDDDQQPSASEANADYTETDTRST